MKSFMNQYIDQYIDQIKSKRYIAAGLVYEQNVLHMASFQGEEQHSNNREARDPRSEGSIRRPGQRRNNIIY